jgi:hypothetical protein
VTRAQRISMVAVALVIVVVGFIALRPGSDNGDKSSSNPQSSSSTATGTGAGGQDGTPQPATIDVVDGKPDGGVKTITFAKGDQIRLQVNSDTADEVHIHGYDIHKDVEAGGSVQFAFPASIDGKFEIELEEAKQQLANLEVTP